MSTPAARPPGSLKSLWYKWQSLRLPWRKKWLVGSDLSGNTFWEFKDNLNSNRLRRIVRHNRRVHFADVQTTPQWHQWLRHTRDGAPSIREQQLDLVRQAQLKQLAAAANARWAAKPSLLDAPDLRQTEPGMVVKDPGGSVQQTEPDWKDGVRNAVGGLEDVNTGNEASIRGNGSVREAPHEGKDHPGDRPKGGPREDRRHLAWTPGMSKRR